MTPAQAEWVRCKKWIEEALPFTGGTHDIEDIEKAVEEGSMVFVPGNHCAVVLEVSPYPNFKVLNVFLGGGEKRGIAMKEYCENMDPYICDVARTTDCKEVRHFCRPGSEPIGKRLGYRKLHVVMSKDV